MKIVTGEERRNEALTDLEKKARSERRRRKGEKDDNCTTTRACVLMQREILHLRIDRPLYTIKYINSTRTHRKQLRA